MIHETDKIKVHPNWLRVMYIVNIVMTLPLGLAFLIAQTKMESFLGWPAQLPVFGVGSGAVAAAVGIVAIAGLLSPLKFSGLLVFQIGEKLIWLFVFAAPNAIAGTLPTFAWVLVAIYVPLTVGNLIAVPWKFMFAKSKL